MTVVTDPELIKTLNANAGITNDFGKEVTDPEIIKHLNAQAGIDQTANPANVSNPEESDWRETLISMLPQSQIEAALIGLGKGGENIATSLTGGRAPRVMDDVKRMLKVPDNIYSQGAEAAGQYGPLAIMPGGLLSQIAAGAGYGALQNPDNPIMGAVTGGITPPVFHGTGKALGGLKNIFNGLFKNIAPYEEAVQKAGQEHELAIQNAALPKPGIYQNPTSELQAIENEIGKNINIGGAHHVDVGKHLQERIPTVINYWKDSYKNFLTKIKDTKYEMPPTAMEALEYEKLNPTQLVKKYGNDAYEALKKGNLKQFLQKQAEKELPENTYYKKLLSYAPTSKDTEAHTFLSKYKDLRDYNFKLKQDLENPNILSSEKEKISEAISHGKQILKQSKEVLSKGLGEHLPEFEWLNQGYSNEVYPLLGNKTAKKVMETGKLSKDMIEELSGNAEGQELLRNMVKQHPESLRNILGQAYKKNPMKLYGDNAMIREYLNELPEFEKLLQKKSSTLENAVKRQDISLKEKVKLEDELKKLRQIKKKNKNILYTGAAVVGVPTGIKWLANAISQGAQQGQGETQ